MAGTVNKVILLGNLSADAEYRTTVNSAVSNFTIVTEDWNGTKNVAEYTRVVLWGKRATGLCAGEKGNLLAKGKRVFVEGRIKTRSYDDKEGNRKWVTEVVADKIELQPNGAAGGSSNGNGATAADAQADSTATGASQETAVEEPVDEFDFTG